MARNSTDLTGASRTGTTGDVSFGSAVGDVTTIGYPDDFREINIALTSAKGAGWGGVLIALVFGDVLPLEELSDESSGEVVIGWTITGIAPAPGDMGMASGLGMPPPGMGCAMVAARERARRP